MNEQIESVGHIRNTVVDLAIRFGPKLLVAILILIAGVLVSGWVSRRLLQALGRFDLEPPARALFARAGWVLCFALFVILALENLGIELLPLIAGLSVLGAGVALATQGVLGNLVAGLTIIFTKPFRVGEYISIVGVEGQVHTINLFSTTLTHVDRSCVVIPNRKIVGEILHNFGRIRQLDLAVAIGYDSNLVEATGAISEALQHNALVLKDPAPIVQATVLGDWSVRIGVRPWVGVQDYVAAAGEINSAIIEALRARGIAIQLARQEVLLIGTPDR